MQQEVHELSDSLTWPARPPPTALTLQGDRNRLHLDLGRTLPSQLLTRLAQNLGDALRTAATSPTTNALNSTCFFFKCICDEGKERIQNAPRLNI